MFLRVLLPLLAIISVNSDQDLDAAKARCNLVDNPKGREKPTDGEGNYCEVFDNGITGYRCCYESYRMLASMVYTCKYIDISSEDKFNEEKDFLKDMNAKNITIKCNGTFTKISMALVIMMSLFMI